MLGVGLGIVVSFLAAGWFSSSSSSDSWAGLEYHRLVRDLRREMVENYLNAEGTFNVFFDEDGPGASSSSVGTATTLSFSGLVSKAGGLPASL